MGDISPGYLFAPSEGRPGLTSIKLNAAGNGATINPSFVSSKPAVSSVTSADQLLLLKADGTYARVPATAVGSGSGAGGGDMFKAVYDTNNNGVVDTCDSLAYSKLTGAPVTMTPTAHASTHLSGGSDPISIATAALAGLCPAVDNTTIQVVASKLSCVALGWSAVTGKPTTFPPDATAELVAHKGAVNGYAGLDATGKVPAAQLPPFGMGDMLKSVYDTNNNGIVDNAESANAVAWTGITGKPAAFTPSAHGTTHLDNGTDPVPVVTTSRTGLAPVLSGSATTFLNGAGAYSTPTGLVPAAHAATHLSAGTDPIALASATLAGLCPAVDNTTIQVVASKLSCVALSYSNLTGVPASFTPSAHSATHLDNGSDPIAIVTTLRTGLAPKLSGTATTYLNGTGAFTTPSGVTPAAHASTHITGGSDIIPAPTISASGLCPAIPGNTTTFLRGDGTFAAVPGGGDMLKSTYDTNNNGVVDTCDSLAWSKLTGVPPGNLVDPGTWTALSLGTGWTAPTQAQYRIETNGTVKTVFFRGMIQAAWAGLGVTAFTLPSTAFPSMTRSAVLAGAQNTGTASDVASYIVSVSSAGVATIYFLGASAFVWADKSQTQLVYLDGLSFSL